MADDEDDAVSARAARREWIAAGCLSLATSALLAFLLLLLARAEPAATVQAERRGLDLSGRSPGYARSSVSGRSDWRQGETYFGPRPPSPEMLARAGGAGGRVVRGRNSTPGW